MLEEKKVVFTNWTDEDFTWKWNGVPYTFKAGEKVMLPDYLAAHFAKHLVNREINKLAEEKGPQVYSDEVIRTTMIDRCYADNLGEEVVEETEKRLEDELKKLKKEELVEKAKEMGIEVDKKDTKKELINKISESNLDDDKFEGNEGGGDNEE